MKANRYEQIAVIASAVLIFALCQTAMAGPPEIPGNRGVPGLLAQITELNQMITDQISTIEELQKQIDDLQALLEAMKNYAPVPQTGKTESRAQGDDGNLQKGVVLPHPRFADNQDGTITDNLTRLIWLKNANCPNMRRGWATALADVASLNSDGMMNGYNCGDTSNEGSHQGDWRLPNIRELHSLVNYDYSSPAISNAMGTAKATDGDPFSNLGIDTWYWTSTTAIGNIDGAGCVDFIAGGIGAVDLINSTAYVTAVRGGD